MSQTVCIIMQKTILFDGVHSISMQGVGHDHESCVISDGVL